MMKRLKRPVVETAAADTGMTLEFAAIVDITEFS
jgi:hypothetical protein